jgi:hypothetical protein
LPPFPGFGPSALKIRDGDYHLRPCGDIYFPLGVIPQVLEDSGIFYGVRNAVDIKIICGDAAAANLKAQGRVVAFDVSSEPECKAGSAVQRPKGIGTDGDHHVFGDFAFKMEDSQRIIVQ